MRFGLCRSPSSALLTDVMGNGSDGRKEGASARSMAPDVVDLAWKESTRDRRKQYCRGRNAKSPITKTGEEKRLDNIIHVWGGPALNSQQERQPRDKIRREKK